MSTNTTINNLPVDPLVEYRVGKLEEGFAVLSEGFASIAATLKGVKWAALGIFGFIQPVGIGILIYSLTRGG